MHEDKFFEELLKEYYLPAMMDQINKRSNAWDYLHVDQWKKMTQALRDKIAIAIRIAGVKAVVDIYGYEKTYAVVACHPALKDDKMGYAMIDLSGMQG